MKSYGRLLVLCGTVATAACGYVPGKPATGSFKRMLAVSGPVRIEVETGSGTIDVRSAETDEVKVMAVVTVHNSWFDKRPSEDLAHEVEKNPPIEQSGEVIRIGTFADRRLRDRVAISYELVVPRRARLQTTTGSGALHIDGVAGPLELRTGSGRIDVTGPRGDVRAETGSGALRLADAREGHFELTTGSGAIDASEVEGALKAHAGSGRISAAGVPVDRWELDTGSGAVHARVPAEAGFDLAAHTGSGRITVARSLSASDVREHAVTGRAGAGGPALALSTGSGEISVE